MATSLFFLAVNGLSIILFWLIAIFCCFCGTETGLKFWFRRITIGAPFFAIFVYVVHAHGVPNYYVYDHVPAKIHKGEAFIPAVKNHLIFQSTRFQRLGVINRDYSDFDGGDELFNSFGIQPIENYPSVNTLTKWTNELALVVLMLSWFFLIAKLQNGAVASSIYRKALKSPSRKNFNSYLMASYSLRYFQPLKRKKAVREKKRIKTIYLAFLSKQLDFLKANVDVNMHHCINYLQKEILVHTEDTINLNVEVNLSKHMGVSGNSFEREKKDGERIILTRDYALPTKDELSSDLSESIVAFLNQLLPEKYVYHSSNSADLRLVTHLQYMYSSIGYFGGKYLLPGVDLYNANVNEVPQRTLTFNNHVGYRVPKLRYGKPDWSRAVASKAFAQKLVKTCFIPVSTAQSDKSYSDAKGVNDKLEELKQRQFDLFETVYNECKSATRDAAISSAVAVAIQKNEVLLDSVMAEMYTVLADNGDLLLEILAEEAIAGFIEGVIENA